VSRCPLAPASNSPASNRAGRRHFPASRAQDFTGSRGWAWSRRIEPTWVQRRTLRTPTPETRANWSTRANSSKWTHLGGTPLIAKDFRFERGEVRKFPRLGIRRDTTAEGAHLRLARSSIWERSCGMPARSARGSQDRGANNAGCEPPQPALLAPRSTRTGVLAS